jgi:hypothetical protein
MKAEGGQREKEEKGTEDEGRPQAGLGWERAGDTTGAIEDS